MQKRSFYVYIAILLGVIGLTSYYLAKGGFYGWNTAHTLEELGIREVYYVVLRGICLFLLACLTASFLLQAYEAVRLWRFSSSLGVELALMLVAAFLAFSAIPLFRLLNFVEIMAHLCHAGLNLPHGLNISLEEFIASAMEGAKSPGGEGCKIPPMGDHAVVFGETADKQKYVCANISKVIEAVLPDGLAKSGAKASAAFFKVSDVACVTLEPAQPPAEG